MPAFFFGCTSPRFRFCCDRLAQRRFWHFICTPPKPTCHLKIGSISKGKQSSNQHFWGDVSVFRRSNFYWWNQITKFPVLTLKHHCKWRFFVVYRGFGSGGCWWLIAGIPHLKVVLTCENISKVVNRNQPLADSIRLDSAWGLRKWRAWNHMLPSASGACASCGC